MQYLDFEISGRILNDPVINEDGFEFFVESKAPQERQGQIVLLSVLSRCRFTTKQIEHFTPLLVKNAHVWYHGWVNSNKGGNPFIEDGSDKEGKPVKFTCYDILTRDLKYLGKKHPEEAEDILIVRAAGYLGRDPEARYTNAGKLVTGFSIGINRGKEETKQTVWMKFSAWGKTGENISKFFSKGKNIFVEGIPSFDVKTGGPRIWEGDSGLNASYEAMVNSFQFVEKMGSTPINEGYVPPASDDEEEEIPF